ncbi:thiamine biosynthesis oxidoreductase ThiO [Legionella steigerwaltii]|uniref:D-amino-acid oxidase n=1 Tax=Legionella steigerwaltii TaxID=460 RepID=A0A378L918_9GAMM|nr:FAD-dependent oxidoreductase [Legionella steigerwaltii]KTD78985.1 thiamine biosynthesis oxidoreductase ThiO [Legionella steigerwaltii]STY23575.1 thiamine biosynthesis oxidoreductase ThiO [Legionella steigerwaltii]
MKNAAVVGAGIMGCLLALRLQNEGWQVTLFEAEASFNNCSYAAAGLLAPLSELDKAEHVIFTLGMESVDTLWKSILNQLTEAVYFRQKGSLVVHHPQDKAEWQQFSTRIVNKLSDSCYQLLTQDTLCQLEPELNQFKVGYYFPKEAQLDNQTLLLALKKHLCQQGVVWRDQTFVSYIHSGKVETGTESYLFDFVFDCRGIGAKSTFTQLRGLRGELIWLHAPEVQLQRPIRFLHPRYNIYIAPRPNSYYLIGASELEAEDSSPISVRTTLELLTAAYYVHRGFAEARIIKTVTHCRPTLIHHQPRIKYAKRLIAVNGLYRHGFLIAPALVEEILRGLKSDQKDIYYPELWEACS